MQLHEIHHQFLNKLVPLYDASEVESLFFEVIQHVLNYNKATYIFHKHIDIPTDKEDQINVILKRLTEGEPLQYILERAWFMGIPFKVTDKVLIPRPETEELVDLIINDYQNIASASLEIMDIGTGSGCIPITLKKHLKQAHLHALDISKEALDIAKQNAKDQHTYVNFLLADILEWDLIFQNDMKFDIIVSNPPYIPPSEQEAMHSNVLQYEPHLALFVEEKAPLLFYETIASFALIHLKENGTLYFEINRNYGDKVADLLRKKGFQQVLLLQDMHGADRMIKASL
ncbi:peptide chain release factor N(5)-glutamine methyltransferase [Olivibacter domesticus]|uniref:peptide chain release factor N(5)-glutamine methyltransferase n=1 Tax=Olivibacter domesticus TaxID=407022 RepID=A0A1H7I246_OLID1|nr:peptide chain release factor N(5)-glutamine methyltransferase [Olivibacter domesticus]SEK55500.1 release factor glutamine methyltransferase [Olivibacter domesticus]